MAERTNIAVTIEILQDQIDIIHHALVLYRATPNIPTTDLEAIDTLIDMSDRNQPMFFPDERGMIYGWCL